MKKFDLNQSKLVCKQQLEDGPFTYVYGVVETQDAQLVAFVQTNHCHMFGYIMPATIYAKGSDFGEAALMLKKALNSTFELLHTEDCDGFCSVAMFDHVLDFTDENNVHEKEQMFHHIVAVAVTHLKGEHQMEKLSSQIALMYLRENNHPMIKHWNNTALHVLPDVHKQMQALYTEFKDNDIVDPTVWHANHPLAIMARDFMKNNPKDAPFRLIVNEQTLVHTFTKDGSGFIKCWPNTREMYTIEYDCGHKESSVADNVPDLMLQLLKHVLAH